MTIENLTSPSNPRIKAACSLRESRERRESGLMIIDGHEAAMHAVLGQLQCTELFIREEPDESHRLAIQHWQRTVPDIRINIVAPAAMAKLQYGDRDHNLIAIARQPSVALETLDERLSANNANDRSHQLFLVLDQIEKPGNLGAMMRTADAVGVTAVLLSDPISETWNPNAIRSSLGALFRIPLAIGSAKQVYQWLTERNVHLISARVDGSHEYTQIEYPTKTAIIVGNEASGLDGRWMQPDVQSVRIAMHGVIDSLNVSVSTSILLFEVLRQRQ